MQNPGTYIVAYGLRHHLQCQHPTWTTVRVPVAPLLSSIPANVSKTKHGSRLQAPAPTWETLLAPSFGPTLALAIEVLWKANQ